MSELKLSNSFLEQYIGKNPNWGFNGLGYIVYLRTYARKKEDGTLESWWETVRRVVEGNFNIEVKRLKEVGKWSITKKNELLKEMKRVYHLMFNLVILPPGRGLWMTGTEYSNKVGDVENNCWFVSCRPQPYGESKIKPVIGDKNEFLPSFPAIFTFDQAMKGGGVGINVQKKNVEQMPAVKNKIRLFFDCDPAHDDYEDELVNLGVEPYSIYDDYLDGDHLILKTVQDSREGWAEALQILIDSHYLGNYKHILFDITNIRPKGAEIKGFGGVASGPAPLVKMLNIVNEILNNRVGEKLTTVEWGDIIQNIGCCVVAGNVRRTALILIGDQEDQEFVESKDYSLDKNLVASQWRWASNNSVDISDETDIETFKQIAERIYNNGEPGIVNIGLSKNYGRIIDGFQENIDEKVGGFNPCGEITLPNCSPCNLFEINLPKIHELIEYGIETDDLYKEVCYLAARYAYRVTFRPYEWEVTRKIVEKHRRLGIGLTGITDWITLRSDYGVGSKLDTMYKYVKEANVKHAAELNSNPSIKLTTVKPSGTLSLLMGVSAGIHYHWSRYMIRRVRIASNSPLIQQLRDCGYNIETQISGRDKSGNPVLDPFTLVVEFPIKAPTAESENFRSSNEVSLDEQFELQSMLQNVWSDNAVSATLTFQQEDGVVEEIADLLYKYNGVLKSTSLLPHVSGTYDQMPLEEITKEQYEEMISKIVKKPWELVGNSVDLDSMEMIGECSGGSCPIR